MSLNSLVSPTKPYSIIVSVVVSVLFLVGCSLPNSIPSSPSPMAPLASPTSILPSPTSMAPLTSPTSTPPDPTSMAPLTTPMSILPSLTPQPTATTAPAGINIVFATGTTAAVERGSVQPGQVVTYRLSAGQSQPMILILDSTNNDVTLGVFEPNGNKLLDPVNKYTRWQWLLPKTELYTIQVIGGGSTENYTLTAKVAQLVYFASGATSKTLNGNTVNGYVFSYALSCKINQTMTVTLNVPSSVAYLDVFGIATGTLLSASAKATTWTGVLPETQEYVIEVIPNNGQVVNYILSVSVH